MDRQILADWLRDIARHIEEESPLIRDVSVDDAAAFSWTAPKTLERESQDQKAPR